MRFAHCGTSALLEYIAALLQHAKYSAYVFCTFLFFVLGLCWMYGCRFKLLTFYALCMEYGPTKDDVHTARVDA